jgi:hypothetical protein
MNLKEPKDASIMKKNSKTYVRLKIFLQLEIIIIRISSLKVLRLKLLKS